MMSYLNFLVRLRSKGVFYVLEIIKVSLLVIFIIYLGFNANNTLI